MVTHDIIEGYIEKVYGYAVKRTYSADEADELSQEILFTAVREFPRLKDESKFEPWFWGIANNVTKSFRRNMGKQRAMYSYNVPENLLYQEQYDESDEIYDHLRTKIAMLSAIYRDIIILYYYDGLSVKQIAQKLNIAEGTVSWRLSAARDKLKKECTDMQETALRPVKMQLNITGNGDYNGTTKPFPTVYIDDALSQNILYYCYEEAKCVEELAKICGVPAFYIEDRIANLLKREAVIEVSKGKYQTDFVIFTDKYDIYCEENAEKCLMPIMDKLIEALKNIAKDASKIDFYKAEKSESDLFALYGIMAFVYVCYHYCKLPYPRFEKKYDGNEWRYMATMKTGKYQSFGLGIQQSQNLGSRGTFSHTSYYGISGTTGRPMMLDNYINVCEDILYSGYSDDKKSVADAVKDGYIIKREDGNFFVTVPAFTKEQKAEFDLIVDKHLGPLMPQYCKIADKFVSGYKNLFPKHLSEDADRYNRNMFLGLYTAVIRYAQKTGAVEMPSPNCHCDVMVQFK